MIDEQHMFHALANIIKSKDIANLIKTVIIEPNDGEYLLYGLYTIRKSDDLYEVSIGSEIKNSFSNLKTAVTWATLDSKNNIMLSQQVNTLDKAISSTEFSIELYKRLHRRTKDIDMKVVYLNKLQDETLKRKKLTRELDLHISKTQAWQLRQFKNQTSK